MPLPQDAFDNMLERLLNTLPPNVFEVRRSNERLFVTGYLKERASRAASKLDEVGRNTIFYVVEGELQSGDFIGDEYVAYDTAPHYGFDQAWKLIRIPPYDYMEQHDLVFHVEGSTWQIDPETGNRIPSRSDVTVKAVLRASHDPKLLDTLGVRPGEVVMEGYCIEPMTLPDGIEPDTKADLTLDGVAGTFTLGPTIPDPMPAKRAAFGEYIMGRWTWQG